MKIVINTCFGGFGLSHKAVMRYAEIKGISLYPWIDAITRKIYGAEAVVGSNKLLTCYSTVPLDGLPLNKEGEPVLPRDAYWSYRDIPRDDPSLIQVVKELGAEANGEYAELSVVEIPDDVAWDIDEYDGNEHVAEQHQTWR